MGGDIKSVLTRLCLAVNEIDKQLGFQQTKQHGYLSSCPTNLGTGMRASVHVKIPHASIHPDFKNICDQYHIQVRNISRRHRSQICFFYSSNKFRLHFFWTLNFHVRSLTWWLEVKEGKFSIHCSPVLRSTTLLIISHNISPQDEDTSI